MRAMLPSIATLAILCAACSDSSIPPTGDVNREVRASHVGGASYPLVSITPAFDSLAVNDSITAQAYLTDANGSWNGRYITWTSSDTTVLRVTTTGTGDADGNVAHITALAIGTAKLTATTRSQTTDELSVAVVDTRPNTAADTVTENKKVAKVSVTPNPVNIATGANYQLVGIAYDSNGKVVTGATLAWRSTGSALSVSSDGLVKGLAKGWANIEGSANGKMAWSTITDTGGVDSTPTTPPPAPPPPPPPPAPPPPPPPPPAPPPAPPPPPPPTGGKQAVWSDKFVGSVGIATHFTYWDLLPYGNNVNQTIASITTAGIRFVRDGLSVDTDAGSNDRYWGVMKTLTQSGLKLVLVTQPVYLGNQRWVTYPYTNQSNLDTAVARVGASGILAFEGPNEVDNNNGNWGGIPAYGANTKAYQAAMYAHSKAIAPSIAVLGLTTTSAYGSSFIGDISSYMDAGTLHPYPDGSIPTTALASTESALGVLNGARKPWWVTEAGYYTAPNATQNVYQPGVSEQAQGKYVPRLYLDYFNAGISHSAVYELIDERNDGVSAEMNYGLLHNDGSPKPAYTALKNMLTLLADPGATYTPASLSYSLTGATSTIRQALFQKRDGRFYLVLWNDVSVYNTSAKSNISNPTVPVTLTLSSAHNLAVYQPYTQAPAMSTAVSATSLSLAVPDHPLIVEVSP